MKPRPARVRVSGLRAEEFGKFILLDCGSAKIEDKTLRFLTTLDGAASHLTAYTCQGTFPSEEISNLQTWMEKQKGFPSATRHAHILPNAQRDKN